MENQTQDQTQTAGEPGTQDVFTPALPPADPVLDAPVDPAELPAADPVAIPSDNSTCTVAVDDDTSITQLIGAQMARARNALAHLEETVARDVHAALAEIESLLGMKD